VSNPRRGRPRSSEIEDRVLRAVLDLYSDGGRDGLTMQAIARRAGCSRSTLYLRWENGQALLSDALRHREGFETSADRGSLRADVGAYVGRVVGELGTAAGWSRHRHAHVVAGRPDPHGATAVTDDDDQRRLAALVERARARGEEVRPDADLRMLALVVRGTAVQVELLRRADDPTLPDHDETVRALEELLLSGLRPATTRPSGSRHRPRP
jgi:AcrR family transcriptional regulator